MSAAAVHNMGALFDVMALLESATAKLDPPMVDEDAGQTAQRLVQIATGKVAEMIDELDRRAAAATEPSPAPVAPPVTASPVGRLAAQAEDHVMRGQHLLDLTRWIEASRRAIDRLENAREWDAELEQALRKHGVHLPTWDDLESYGIGHLANCVRDAFASINNDLMAADAQVRASAGHRPAPASDGGAA